MEIAMLWCVWWARRIIVLMASFIILPVSILPSGYLTSHKPNPHFMSSKPNNILIYISQISEIRQKYVAHVNSNLYDTLFNIKKNPDLTSTFSFLSLIGT